MKKIGVITTSRADYGIYRPLLKRLHQDTDLQLCLFVSGSHLSHKSGMTVYEIEQDGFPITECVPASPVSDTPQAIAEAMGSTMSGFASAYARSCPDWLVALGDRYEMFAAVAAAAPFCIPVAHLHGGESSEGAIDENFRHAITKLSHLHFTSTDFQAQRLIRMGEEPWRVSVCGALSLDNLHEMDLMSRETLSELCSIDFYSPVLLVTFHPVTLQYEDATRHINALLSALAHFDTPVLFTQPNEDTASRIIMECIQAFLKTHPASRMVANMGSRAYFSAMRYAAAMAGNSSSGIIEAASFALPVVNIGDRQKGRLHIANVVDCPCDAHAITDALHAVLAPAFRENLRGLSNPYDKGGAADIIMARLKNTPLGARLLMKSFWEVPATQERTSS